MQIPDDEQEKVTRYLFNWRQDLFTDAERAANHVANWLEKADASGGKSGDMLRRKAASKATPETNALIKDGYRAFRAQVRDRILAEHGDGVLHRCPRCRGLCRTPRARQCPHCFHGWH